MSPFSMWERFNLILDTTHDVTPDEALARTCGNTAPDEDDL
ncbi:hypothetical protein HDE80_001360 [Rhodanobacter sp. A1T4]|nr:hypothetical protein [Rhodanobacter sp. A1T4]